MSRDNNKIASTAGVWIGSILVALVPGVCKWVTRMPQSAYWAFAFAFLLLAIIAYVICLRNKKQEDENLWNRYRLPLYLSILSGAFFLFIFIYPSITVEEQKETVEFMSRVHSLDSLRVEADGGDVDAQLDLGIAVSHPAGTTNLVEDWSLINFQEADKYFEMAASRNSADAYAYLADMKFRGYGKMKSRKRAIDDVKEGYRKDSTNATILSLVERFGISKEEFPEGVRAVEKLHADQRESRAEFDRIIQGYLNMTIPPVDVVGVSEYCSEMLPRIEGLDVDYSGEEQVILAEMCFYAGEYEKGYEYAKSLFHGDDPVQISRILFTGRQVYSERQRSIHTVLENTEDAVLKGLSDTYGQALGLDRYYMKALELELMKRQFTGIVILDKNNNRIPLKEFKEFKEFQDSFSSLSQEFVEMPAKESTLSALPDLRIRIVPDEEGGYTATYQCSGEDK